MIDKDTLTRAEVAERLKAFWEAEELMRNPYTPRFEMPDPVEPSFGQAPANIDFGKTDTALDFPAEPPVEPASAFVVVLCGFVLVALPVMALWSFLAYVLPWMAGVVVAWAGR